MTQLTVKITSGLLGGANRNGVATFLGVPYAAPPVAERRFAVPVPHDHWEGTRDATQPGPTAPQFNRPFPKVDVTPFVGQGWKKGGDSLTANIWTPDPSASGLPVMVFIHGGAFVLGSNNASVSDGAAFARSRIVCIGLNYRLGVEGFLPVPGVPTNLGLRDLLAALQWTQGNAAAFGDDPANITLLGESSGAMLIGEPYIEPWENGDEKARRGLYSRAQFWVAPQDVRRGVPDEPTDQMRAHQLLR